MLIQRLLATIVLIPLVIICLFFLPMSGFISVMTIICVLSAWEWSQFLHLHAVKDRAIFTTLFTAFILVGYYLISISPNSLMILKIILSLAIVWWIIALLLVISYPCSMKFWQNNVIKTLFACFTLVPFLVGMIVLREIYMPFESYKGAFLVLYVLVLVWATDSGAYFAGRALGKHKLAPKVSPGKTIEGFVGGVILAVIIVIIAYASGYFAIASFSTFIIGSLCAILVSVLGDLTESMFKREANIKDSGHLIPGHGGILDRIDSLTAAIPVFAAVLFLL